MVKWTVIWLPVLLMAFGLPGCPWYGGHEKWECLDLDGDGFGLGPDCLGPDCDDGDPTVWAHIVAYPDEDGDRFCSPDPVWLCASELPSDYCGKPGFDCDDGDASIWATIPGYPDRDGDGVFSPEAVQICARWLPSGYRGEAGTDCDDDDGRVWRLVELFVDLDGDGIGAGVGEHLCIGEHLPEGRSESGTDCDDEDETAWERVEGYADLDGDGVLGQTRYEACTDGTLPAGWSDVAGTDCDDFDPASFDGTLDSTHVGCDYPGTCLDTEGLNPLIAVDDYRGVGACQSIDCNGLDPRIWDPALDTDDGCDDDEDCLVEEGEFCFDGTCWEPGWVDLGGEGVIECAHLLMDEGGLTCSELVECLEGCSATHEGWEYVECLQHGCIESATPKAQLLYNIAQTCAATMGCYVPGVNALACILTHCVPDFSPCHSDVPPE